MRLESENGLCSKKKVSPVCELMHNDYSIVLS